MSKSIGALELRSISKGIEVSNEIVKQSNVEIIYFKTVCPGKFLVIVSGDEEEVSGCISYGEQLASDTLLDSFCVHAVCPEIIDAFKNKYDDRSVNGAIGIMETFHICSGIKALDYALKAGEVSLIKLQTAFTIGGKVVFIVTGNVSSVEYALQEGERILDENEKVITSVITSPSEEIIKHLL